MGKKRKIFIFSALAAGIAVFFGRKRMKGKSEDTEGTEGEWTPDEDATSDADGSSDSSATEGDTADDADSDASGDTAAADEKEAEKTD